MRANDDAITVPDYLLKHLVDAQIQHVILLPGRGYEHHGLVLGGMIHGVVGGYLPIHEVVAVFHEFFRRESLQFFGAPYLLHLMGTGAHDDVIVIEGISVGREVRRCRMVEHEHIGDVVSHVGALQVKVVEVLQGGDDDIGVHLHEQRDGFLLADVVRENAGLLLGQGEDLVVGIVGDVVDARVGVGEEPLDGPFEVLVEAASL